jgi:AcrR family transcriptional regulator
MTATTKGAPTGDRGRTTAVGDATRIRLMQAAERLIAGRGLQGVSVRDITAAADTNSAAIHYHFMSKEGLVRAIMDDRAAQLGERRRQHLGALDDVTPTVRQVAEAVVHPTFEFVSGQHQDSDTAYVGFLAALLDDPDMVPALDLYFADQYEAYYQALQRARPDLSRAILVNRVCFALHLVLNTASEPARGLRTWIERHHAPSMERIQSDLVEFVAGGFGAP